MSRVEVGGQWAEVRDLKQISFGEVRRMRAKASAGGEDEVIAVAASCVESWNGKDSRTGEDLGPCTAETLDRVTPAFGLAICNVVAEGLSAAIPLASKKESSPS